MSRALPSVVGAFAFALLATVCLVMDVPRIAHDIESRAAEALVAAGISGLDVDVSGRDISVSGRRALLDSARGPLATVTGVRTTLFRATREPIVTPTPAPFRPPPTPPRPTQSAADVGDRIRDLTDGRPIRFRTGSADLLPESRGILDELAALLRDTEFGLEIEGHTDATGSAQRNLALSQARAESVLAYLVGQGIAARRMTATGVGAARPIASNANARGRVRNRRIEFNVTSSN